MAKPKVAFFDFACCEGCQLQVANIGELLLDLLGAIDVVEFREVMSEKWDKEYDVAIIEGSITTEHAVERIKEIRKRSKILVAYGSCATIGGVNGMKNNFSKEDISKYVYGDSAKFFPTIDVMAVHQVVKVDYFVHGCPIYPPEFVKVIKAILAGLPYYVPDNAVCTECKLNENVCVYERGVTCLGPVTRAGCNSWCINNGNICYGCRGMVTNPNENGARDVIQKYNINMDLVVNKLKMYNTCREKDIQGKAKNEH
ncbi:MAG: cytochrome B [Candidatus Margulisbacteria bacterium]|nr:cytochrome B [Candidatus Margulisiibacteriota bacterium]